MAQKIHRNQHRPEGVEQGPDRCLDSHRFDSGRDRAAHCLVFDEKFFQLRRRGRFAERNSFVVVTLHLVHVYRPSS